MAMHTITPKSEITDDDLMRMIEQDPFEPGRHGARFSDYGHHVWTIILHLQFEDGDVDRVADSFGMTEKAVRAGIRYYEQHRELIDAKILLVREAETA